MPDNFEQFRALKHFLCPPQGKDACGPADGADLQDGRDPQCRRQARAHSAPADQGAVAVGGYFCGYFR